MIIYKATNEVNSKSYIGQTTNSLKCRKDNHFKKEAKLLVEDAKKIVISISIKNFSHTKVKHKIAIICKRYAELYGDIINKEKE